MIAVMIIILKYDDIHMMTQQISAGACSDHDCGCCCCEKKDGWWVNTCLAFVTGDFHHEDDGDDDDHGECDDHDQG